MRARSKSDLVAESKTLWYEFDQLCRTAEKLLGGTHAGDRVVHNALVESFAICCRRIGCFFFPHDSAFPPLKSDDLGALHYVPDWAARAPNPSATLKDAKARADRQVAHFTSERKNLNFAAGNSFEWQVGPIVAELRAVLAAFLNSVQIGLLDTDAHRELGLLAAPLAPVLSIPAAGFSMAAKTCPPDSATVITTICPKSSAQATTE